MSEPRQAVVRRVVRLSCLAVIAAAAAGCDLFTIFIQAPTNLDVIVGGPSNIQPFFGRVRTADLANRDIGDFLLSTCGCGDWRAVVAYDDGTLRHQFPVKFYTTGEYVPTGSITVFAQDDPAALLGAVDQDAGTADGRVEINAVRMTFTSARGENHDVVNACVYCHIGDDPIYPLPDTHPPDYLEESTSCLECHSVTGE